MKMTPWPTCPQCGTKRVARCPYCRTEGNDFPLADLEMLTAPELTRETLFYRADCYSHEEDPDVIMDPNPLSPDWIHTTLGQEQMRLQNVERPEPQTSRNCEDKNCQHQSTIEDHSCTCSSCGCGSQRRSSLKLVDPLEPLPEIDAAAGEYPLTVKCPLCDEVLLPKFLDTCQCCGHVFEDGISQKPASAEDFSENPVRMGVIFIVLVVLLGLVILAMARTTGCECELPLGCTSACRVADTLNC